MLFKLLRRYSPIIGGQAEGTPERVLFLVKEVVARVDNHKGIGYNFLNKYAYIEQEQKLGKIPYSRWE